MSKNRAWLLSICSLGLLASVGCAEDSADPVDPGMDAGPDASVTDSAVPDANIDARAPDASSPDGGALDASSTACYSPFYLPAQPGTFSRERGCPCEETNASREGYCVESFALLCDGRWSAVIDGPCFPENGPSSGWCAARGGAVPSDGQCPSGFHRKAAGAGTSADAGIERSCCIPIEVSAAECTSAAFRVATRAQGPSLLGTSCAGGGVLRAFIRGSTSDVCCE